MWSRTILRGISLQRVGASVRGVRPSSLIGDVCAQSLRLHTQSTSASKTANAKYFNSRQFSVQTGKEAATMGHEKTLNTKSGTEVNVDAEAEAEDDYYVDVSNLENRWNTMSFESQQDVISYLNVKQEFGWEYLLPEEKRAIYYIAYGNWGPRDQQVMTGAEFAFKLLTSMLLFSVLGFTVLNYSIDQEKLAELEKEQ